MIVREQDIIETHDGLIYVCLQYVNTEEEDWNPVCFRYGTEDDYNNIPCKEFKRVLDKENFPEYYL